MRYDGTDRRTRRTRQLLMTALVDLIRVKRYDAITVQEITDRADVGRSTFYAHFTDKDDLFMDGVRRMVMALETVPPNATNTLAPSLGLFHHVAEHVDLHLVVSRGRALELFLSVLQEELTSLFAERLAVRAPQTPTAVPVPLLAAMTAAMLISAVDAWLRAGLHPSAETIDRSFTTAAEAALHAGLRPAPGSPPRG